MPATGDPLKIKNQRAHWRLQRRLFFWLNDRLIASRLAVVDAVNLVFARHADQVFVASDFRIDVGVKNFFVGVVGKGQRIAFGIADSAITNKVKTTLGSYSIDGHEIDVVFESAGVGNQL